MVAGRVADEPARGAASRILEIMQFFTHDRPEATASALAAACGIPESTVFRLLRLLESYGFITHDPVTSRYSPGLKVIQLGDIAVEHMRLRNVVQPVLDDLQTASQETANFSIWRGKWRVCVAKANSSLQLRDVVNVGEQYPIWLGAAGKAIVAYRPETEQLALTQEYLTEPAAQKTFLRALAEVRRTGLAVTEDERVGGVRAYSAPVLGRDGFALGSVTISGPSFRLRAETIKFGDLVRLAARVLSEALT